MTTSTLRFAGVLSIVLSATAVAAPIPDSSTALVTRCTRAGASCELEIFREIAKVYRPSAEERALGTYILQLKAMAERNVWRTRLQSQQDAMGNTVIWLPATGKYVSRPVPSIAIQAHMDMVLAYKTAQPGEDLRKYFTNGVQLELTGDWLHSKDFMTTLGADDGIGVSMVLHYLLDPRLEHPPLELVFTVQEETGLVGALGMQIPLRSRQMLNLDGMAPEPATVITGSMGAVKSFISGSFRSTAEKPDTTQLKIVLANLAGGHSGGMIHKDRLNSIVGFSQLMSAMYAQIPEMRIVSMVAGDQRALNKIPNAFIAVVSIPNSKMTPTMTQDIEAWLKKLVLTHADENKQGFQVQVTQVPAGERHPEGVSDELSRLLVEALLQAPNGVIEKNPSYPNSVLTSSNMGAWNLDPSAGESYEFKLGYMTRSYSNSSKTQVAKQIQETLEAPLRKFGSVSTRTDNDYIAWSVPSNSPLLRRALSLNPVFSKTGPVNVGLEPSAFMARYPNMDIIAINAYIKDAHTINESVSVKSVNEVSRGIQTLLSSF